MITTIETVAICQIGDIQAMAQFTGASITLIRDKDQKDSFNNSTFFLTLEQAKNALRCLDRAIKEYESTPRRELTE